MIFGTEDDRQSVNVSGNPVSRKTAAAAAQSNTSVSPSSM